MIGIIGGSGFYGFLDNPNKRKIETPFGIVNVEVGNVNNKEICFIPRHGKDHSILPSNINYRANIFAAHELDVEFILATNAVGSLDEELRPGTLAVPDQIIDFTSGRESTFFDGGDFSITTKSGKKLEGVVHTDVSQPYDEHVRQRIIETSNTNDIPIHSGGTMAVANGPRYETVAEIKAYRILGADYVGMTSSPEAFLAKEIEMPYATVAVITNYAAGMQTSISHEEVGQIFSERIDSIKLLFSNIILDAN